MDWITKQCLQLLEEPQTTRSIAMELGLDQKPVYTRLKKLREQGEIEMTMEGRKGIWKKK